MRHIEGKANTVSDTLSRGEISEISLPQPGVDYKAMAAAQPADASVSQPSRQPPLVLSSGTYRWTTTAIRSRVTYPLADPDHSSQTRGNAPCLMLYTTSPTRQSEQRNKWSRLSLYDLAYGSKSASGRKLVFVVKRPKYIDTLPPQWTSLCWLASQALIGSMNYHVFCAVSAPYPKRTSNVHRRRWCMKRH